MGTTKQLSQEQVNYIIQAYSKEHKSMATIGSELEPPVSKTVIRRILTENNIAINQTNHKYYANYRIFQNIDNAEKAYWLGFIAADGCVYVREKNATVKICLKYDDVHHLEKLKTFMDANVNIAEVFQTTGFASVDKPAKMAIIAFNSKEMAQDCINCGVVQNKSHLLEKPNIKEEYYLPYILGYFDGDGSIYETSNGEFGINIIGTRKNIEWINEILQVSQKLEKRHEDKETYHIRCGGTNKPYSIMKKLYDSCPVHLDRKYEVFKKLESVVLKRNL